MSSKAKFWLVKQPKFSFIEKNLQYQFLKNDMSGKNRISHFFGLDKIFCKYRLIFFRKDPVSHKLYAFRTGRIK